MGNGVPDNFLWGKKVSPLHLSSSELWIYMKGKGAPLLQGCTSTGNLVWISHIPTVSQALCLGYKGKVCLSLASGA